MILRPSPNQRPRPPGSIIDTVILHYTGMRNGGAALDRLCDPASGVSSHYVVEEDGRIFRLVDETSRAAHAGVSVWQEREDLNDSSIGVEIVNPGHDWGYRAFPAVQIDAVRALCLSVMHRHPVQPWRVLGHSDVAPDRKQDPGELFPWQVFARSGIGFWPQPETAADDATDDRRLRHALARIGYRRPQTDESLAVVLRAFQRHWRPERVDGQADPATCRLVAAVAAGLALCRAHETGAP